MQRGIIEKIGLRADWETNALVVSGYTAEYDTIDIPPANAVEEIRKLQAMYQGIADRYWQAADMIERLGADAIAQALTRVRDANKAGKELTQALCAQRDDSGGTYGRELLETLGIETLASLYQSALSALSEQDMEIACATQVETFFLRVQMSPEVTA